MHVIHVGGSPPTEIDVELRLKTAGSNSYPRATQPTTRFRIVLPPRYPLEPPTVTISTSILHPNVYPSGLVCLGLKWVPSLGLDLLVRRVAQIITFDREVLNEASPANRAALDWYRVARVQSPTAFPSDSLMFLGGAGAPKKKIGWTNLPTGTSEKVTIRCPSCQAQLSVPGGRSGDVRCPKCGNKFEVRA